MTEDSQVFEARRLALALATEQRWGQLAVAKLETIVTEIATDLVRRAQTGEIHLGLCYGPASLGIEVLAIDGKPSLKKLEDLNPSTSGNPQSSFGSPQGGLAAVVKLAHEYDVYSQEGKGKCQVARLYPETDMPQAKEGRSLTVGSIQVPVTGERECGDSWGFRVEDDRAICILADGLGHGPAAAEASRRAVEQLGCAEDLKPVALLGTVHRALRPTRGAVVAVAAIDFANNDVCFAGVGNISASIVRPTSTHHLVSLNGTAGHNVEKLLEFCYPWTPDSLLLMHSDGIASNWSWDSYPGLQSHHPSLIAATLFKNAGRERDDACVVGVRSAPWGI